MSTKNTQHSGNKVFQVRNDLGTLHELDNDAIKRMSQDATLIKKETILIPIGTRDFSAYAYKIAILQEDITFNNEDTINIPKGIKLIFNDHIIKTDGSYLCIQSGSQFGDMDYDNYPELDFGLQKCSIFANERVEVKGMLKTTNNKLYINRFTIRKHNFDLTLLNSFLYTEFLVDTDCDFRYGSSSGGTRYETDGLTDRCILRCERNGIIRYGAIEINGYCNIMQCNFKDGARLCYISEKDGDITNIIQCQFDGFGEIGVYAISDIINNPVRALRVLNVKHCSFNHFYAGIFMFCIANSHIENNKFTNMIGTNIRFSCGWDNNISYNKIDGGITGIIFIPSENRNLRFFSKYGFAGWKNNHIHSNTLNNIKEEGISFDIMCVAKSEYENAKLRAPNRNTLIIKKIPDSSTISATFEYLDNVDSNDLISYYHGAVICSITNGKFGNWSIIKEVTKSSTSEYLIRTESDAFFTNAELGDKYCINIGYVNNYINNNSFFNCGSAIALYNNVYGNIACNNIINHGKHQFMSCAYIQGDSDIFRTHLIPACDNSFINIISLVQENVNHDANATEENNISRITIQDNSPGHGMDNTGITTSACINNRIVNCKAPGIYIYNCQDNYMEILNCQIDNLTIFVSRSCFIKDCFINKKYNIDGNNLLSNISPTNFSPGSTLYDNERKQYIYTNGINWKLF